jgi:hypothetical protein
MRAPLYHFLISGQSKKEPVISEKETLGDKKYGI